MDVAVDANALPSSVDQHGTVVAVDTHPLYTSRAGVARYVKGLFRGFERCQHAGLQIRDIAWKVENFGYEQPGRAFRTLYRECVWAPIIAPIQLRKYRAVVFHSTSIPLLQPPKPMRHVVTLHDLAPMSCEARFRRWHAVTGSARLKKVCHADRVICISQFTADEGMRLLGIPASKIEVIHNGCDFVDADSLPEELPEFTVPAEFFLFVGSLEPGKNLALLREAYFLGEQRGHSLPPLLIVGSRWEGTANEGQPPRGWCYLGRQSDKVLLYLYRRALALLFPSKYEGFGLPIAEAMACGCPVICSRLASLPEVAGEAALYAEQTAASYMEAMRRIQSDSILRGDLIDAGRSQVQQFTWDRCASATESVYRALV